MENSGYLILLYIAIVFFPGILWAFIDSRYGPSLSPVFTFFIAKSFLFGIISYSIMIVIVIILVLLTQLIAFSNNIDLFPIFFEYYKKIFTFEIHELFIFTGVVIASTMILTAFLSKAWLIISRQGWLLKFYGGYGGVPSTGGIDIWTDTWRNILAQKVQIYNVKVIDYKNKRIYIGEIDSVSVSEKPREMFLKFVQIYNYNENTENCSSPINRDYVYIDLKEGNICVELIDKTQTNNLQTKQKENISCLDQ